MVCNVTRILCISYEIRPKCPELFNPLPHNSKRADRYHTHFRQFYPKADLTFFIRRHVPAEPTFSVGFSIFCRRPNSALAGPRFELCAVMRILGDR